MKRFRYDLLVLALVAAALTSIPVGARFAEMTGGAAIRGCENYVELEPVTMEDAASCLAYCEGNNADACEFRDHGFNQCYVEFGTGCQVEEGYYSWNAAVLHP